MSENYLITDYNYYTSSVAKVILSLEKQRKELFEIRSMGSNTAEISLAISNIEQALLQLDHYVKRREKYGVYNLNIPETTERFEADLRKCYSHRATETKIRIYVDAADKSIHNEFTLPLGDMATVGELHYFIYRQLRGLVSVNGLKNVSPYYVETDNDTDVSTLAYFINPMPSEDVSTTLSEVVNEITDNSTQYFRKASAHAMEVAEGKILFLIRDYEQAEGDNRQYIVRYVELGDLTKKLAENDQNAIERYSSIMLGIERLFKDNGVVVFGLSRLPGTMVSFSKVDLSLFDKVNEIIQQYNK